MDGSGCAETFATRVGPALGPGGQKPTAKQPVPSVSLDWEGKGKKFRVDRPIRPELFDDSFPVDKYAWYGLFSGRVLSTRSQGRPQCNRKPNDKLRPNHADARTKIEVPPICNFLVKIQKSVALQRVCPDGLRGCPYGRVMFLYFIISV